MRREATMHEPVGRLFRGQQNGDWIARSLGPLALAFNISAALAALVISFSNPSTVRAGQIKYGIQDVGSLGGATAAGLNGLNQYGDVVGQSVTPSGSEHAFLWTPLDGISDLGTFSFSIPKSACCFAVIAILFSSTTSATISMYGLSVSCSNHSDTCSANTDGANGRNDSRYLILRFITDCIFWLRGSPNIERPPRARGPNSMRP